MKIGYSVEGSTDRALLWGLRDRWCPDAQMIQGHFRGSTGVSMRREIRKIWDEFLQKGVDVAVFFMDANDRNWREVKNETRERVPGERLEFTIIGVADRNVECWIWLDPSYVASALRLAPQVLHIGNPKERFVSAMSIERDDRKEPEIAALVRDAPLRRWLAEPSFEDFYDQIRAMSLRRACEVENLRQSMTG